jgi:hypothetical protein
VLRFIKYIIIKCNKGWGLHALGVIWAMSYRLYKLGVVGVWSYYVGLREWGND